MFLLPQSVSRLDTGSNVFIYCFEDLFVHFATNISVPVRCQLTVVVRKSNVFGGVTTWDRRAPLSLAPSPKPLPPTSTVGSDISPRDLKTGALQGYGGEGWKKNEIWPDQKIAKRARVFDANK